jgi:hypothetical protein
MSTAPLLPAMATCSVCSTLLGLAAPAQSDSVTRKSADEKLCGSSVVRRKLRVHGQFAETDSQDRARTALPARKANSAGWQGRAQGAY